MLAINFIAVFNMSILLVQGISCRCRPITGQMLPESLLKTIKQNKIKKIKSNSDNVSRWFT